MQMTEREEDDIGLSKLTRDLSHLSQKRNHGQPLHEHRKRNDRKTNRNDFFA